MKKAGWTPRTRQKEGEKTERRIVKSRGGRVHPRSGAGSIKDDGSSGTEIIEVKDVAKSHTLKGDYLDSILRRAIRQEKDAVYIIVFKEAKVTATIRLSRS